MRVLSHSLSGKLCLLILFFSCKTFLSFAQTTEGTEFWLSFMGNEKTPELSIMVSAKRACTLTITNPNTGYSQTATLVPGLNKIPAASTPVSEAYVSSSEVVEKKSLLISSTDTIALFASNYVAKVFDVASILPTKALLDEYMIQTYKNSSQKQSFPPEFLIVATEDSTIVDITPTWATLYGKPANVAFEVRLNKGECYQVQAEKVQNSTLSGSLVKARNGKKIAVFNGDMSEAIPYGSGDDGDHLFEQAMPVPYWGTQFVVTRSMNRAVDKVCITAKNNDTSIKRNGTLIATINSGQTFEFEVLNPDEAAYIETSCPCAVYLYLVSNHKFDTSNALGGPSMIWINPIEQMIKEINFCTYTTANTSNHYMNLVTKTTGTAGITLSGVSTGNKALTFTPVPGNADYSYARTTLADDSYSLKSTTGVIAHVYGLGTNESYGYSVGGAVKSLEQYVMINGEEFAPGADIKLCSLDTIHYSCDLNFETENIIWNFGDGSPSVSGKTLTSVDHYYPNAGQYNAYMIVQRMSSNLCQGQLARDSVAIKVNIEKIQVSIDTLSRFICASEGKFKAYFTKQAVNNITAAEIKFSNTAKAQGFGDGFIQVKNNYFEIPIPTGVAPAKVYTADIIAYGVCTKDTFPINFMVNYPVESVLTQRWNDVLAVKNATENGGYNFVDFQWYKNDSIMPADTISYIYLGGSSFNTTDQYYVKLTTADGLELCTCKKSLTDKSGDENNYLFDQDIQIESTFARVSSKIKVETMAAGTVYFRDLTGRVYNSANITESGDFVTAPDRAGIYLMDVRLINGQRKAVKVNVIK